MCRGGKFDPYIYEWVDCVFSQMGQIRHLEKRGIGQMGQRVESRSKSTF